MAVKNPNISISFSTSKALGELKGLTDHLKIVKKEFEVSNIAIQATGNANDIAANKIAGYAKQAEVQRTITNQVKKTIEEASQAHAAAGQRVEAARLAFEKASKSENSSKEEIQKLKKELDTATNTYDRLGKAVQTWNSKLLDSQKAENKLQLAVKQTNDEVDKHNKKLADTVKSTSNVTSATGQLHNVYSLLYGLAVGYAGKTLYEALIGDNSKFEQYMASFEVLLGGADNAKKRMAELTQFAAITPFELPQVVEAEKRLLAYGVAAKDTQNTLQMLGDISMGNADKLNLISLAYGQVVTNQRLYGTELRQFAENGVPLLAELAKMYGVTEAQMRGMVEDGQISADAVTAALQRMTSEGGKFFGMMEKQSQTMQGMWSTLKDNISMFAREVGEDSFEYLKDELQTFLDTLNQMSQSGELSDIAAEWGRNIAGLIDYIVDAVKILWDMKEALAAVGITLVAFKTAMAISGVINTLITAIETYTTAINAGKTATAAFTAVMNVNPWVLLASAIAAVVTGIIGYNLISGEAKDETDELAQKTANLTDEYERNIKAAERSSNSKLGEVSIAQKLASELERLSEKTNKTNEDKVRMVQIVDQLNSKIPNLALQINSETGELNKQIGVVYNAISAYKQLLFVKASEKKASAAAESLIDLNEQKSNLEKELASYKGMVEQYNKYKMSQFFIKQGLPLPDNLKDVEFPNISEEDLAKYNSLVTQLDEVNKLIDDANGKIADSFNASQEYTAKYGKPTETNTYNTPPPLTTDPKKAAKDAEQARKEAIQKEFDDLKFYKDMGYITEEEYYNKLAELRDKYFTSGSSEWQQYTLEIKKYNDDLAKELLRKRQEEYKSRLEDSNDWISEQKELNNLSVEDEIAAYERIKAYTKEYYEQGIISLKEYQDEVKKLNKSIADAAKQGYKSRADDSNNWIDEQKFYGTISPVDEIAAYERVKAYTKEYYEQGIISFEEYQTRIKELDKSIYSVRKDYIKDYIDTYINGEKTKLEAAKKAIDEEAKDDKEKYDNKKKAIEDYYDSLDLADKQQDRAKKMADLREQESIYQNAATKEGMDKLKKIRDDIAELNKEAEKEQRELTKKAQIAKLDKELEENDLDREKRLKDIETQQLKLDNAHQNLISKIGEYAIAATGTIQEAINKVKSVLESAATSQASSSSSNNSSSTNSTTGEKFSVTINDYGTKTFANTDDINDYGSELLSSAKNAIRAGI